MIQKIMAEAADIVGENYLDLGRTQRNRFDSVYDQMEFDENMRMGNDTNEATQQATLEQQAM